MTKYTVPGQWPMTPKEYILYRMNTGASDARVGRILDMFKDRLHHIFLVEDHQTEINIFNSKDGWVCIVKYHGWSDMLPVEEAHHWAKSLNFAVYNCLAKWFFNLEVIKANREADYKTYEQSLNRVEINGKEYPLDETGNLYFEDWLLLQPAEAEGQPYSEQYASEMINLGTEPVEEFSDTITLDEITKRFDAVIRNIAPKGTWI